MKEYNLGAILVNLHDTADSFYIQSQQMQAGAITKLNDRLRDISDLTNHLSRSLPSGNADLTRLKDTVERIRNLDPDLLLDAKSYVLKTAEEIKTQMELLKEKAQYLSQQINLGFTKMNQKAKDNTEVVQMLFDMMKSHRDQMKSFSQLLR